MYNNYHEETNDRISALNRRLENCENRKLVENDSIRVISNEGQFGCLSFTLVWDSTDDLDLHVNDTRNNHIYFRNYCKSYDNKFTNTGGQLDVDLNAGNVNTNEPVENVFFRCNPPSGIYIARVNFYEKRNSYPVNYKLMIRKNGILVKEHQGFMSYEGEITEVIRFNYNESA
jgi:uncharacterized protein YfaP (DUF2135 family)